MPLKLIRLRLEARKNGQAWTLTLNGAEFEVDTKTAIIEAAFSALKADGLPALSYDRIAQEAEVSRQLVRYHFSHPDDLMVTLCDHLAAIYRDKLIENARNLSGPMRLEMFLDFYFGMIEGHGKPADDQVYDALMARAAGSERVRKSLRDQYSLLGTLLGHELQLVYPNLSKQASEELSYVFVSLMYGHWKMVASLGVDPSHNRVARRAMSRMILNLVEDGGELASDTRIWAHGEGVA